MGRPKRCRSEVTKFRDSGVAAVRWWIAGLWLASGCPRADAGPIDTRPQRDGDGVGQPEDTAESSPRREVCAELARGPAVVHDGMRAIGAVEGRNASYDEQRQPARVVAALQLREGWRVADVGAGLGYFEPRLSAAVGPSGMVVATDVDPVALQGLCASTADLTNVDVRRTPLEDPQLEPGTYDLILLSEVDHFLHDRVGYLRKLASALAPDGTLAVTHARAMKEPLLAATTAAGLHVVREVDDLPDHYLVFVRP